MAENNTSFGKTSGSSVLGVNQLAGQQQQLNEELKKQVMFDIRCCCPAIIKSINLDEMTATVQPVIKEKIQFGSLELQEMQLPEIQDVPIISLSSGSKSDRTIISFPLHVNDECLLFFSDTCIDAWWQSGGIQSQFEERRHDLSDCFCLPCQMSQPLKNEIVKTPRWVYNEDGTISQNGFRKVTDGLALQKGETSVILEDGSLEFVADKIMFNGGAMNMNNHYHTITIELTIEGETITRTLNTSGAIIQT